jgi:hypothetical protein
MITVLETDKFRAGEHPRSPTYTRHSVPFTV